MSGALPVIRVLSEEKTSDGKKERSGRKSVTVKPDVSKLDPEKQTTTQQSLVSEERKQGPEIKPPMRRISSAVNVMQLEGKNRNTPPPKQRCMSQAVAPKLDKLNIPQKHMGISSRKISLAMSRTQLYDVLAEIQEDSRKEEILKIRELPPAKPEDIKALHYDLKASYSAKTAFKMSFQSKFGSVRSCDSGMSSSTSDLDDCIVDSWIPKWKLENSGSEPGQIKSIRGICFLGEENVAVTEEKNSRIQIFDKKKGHTVKILQDKGTLRKMNPAGICQLPNRPILAATDLNRIVYFEPSFDDIVGSRTLEEHLRLYGIAANAREHLIVTDLDKKKVFGYDTEGRLVIKFKSKDFVQPTYVAVSDEYSMVFVSDSLQGCVYMFSKDGELLHKIGNQATTADEKLLYPMGVCCLPNGKLVVADKALRRLQTYDFRARCCEHLLTADNGINFPTCIASDGSKYIAVSEENEDYKLNEYKLNMFYKTSR